MATLFFLLTTLALIGTLIVSPIALVQRRLAMARLVAGGMLVWLVVYGALLFGFAWFTPQTILVSGQEHCFDEMCFAVTRANSVATAQANTITVTLRLRNAALHTAQKPDHPDAYLVDQRGKSYQPSAAGQQPVWDQQLPAGTMQERTLSFVVPAHINVPYLIVTEGSFPAPLIIGNENSPFHKKTEFRLFP